MKHHQKLYLYVTSFIFAFPVPMSANAEYYIVSPASSYMIATCGNPCGACQRCTPCHKHYTKRYKCDAYYEMVIGVPYYTYIEVNSPRRVYHQGSEEAAPYAWIP